MCSFQITDNLRINRNRIDVEVEAGGKEDAFSSRIHHSAKLAQS